MALLFRSKPIPLTTLLSSLTVIFLITRSTADTLDGELSVYDVLQSYDFPVGLLPVGATGYELDISSGKFAAYLNGSCSFNISGYKLKYKSTITGYISKGKLEKLKGVTVKILLIWVDIIEVSRSKDGLDFSVGIASADFPIDNFEEMPQCGCGFECNKKHVRTSIRSNPFVSSS
ncbi:hypothetical protein GIB67_003807 [Kingdonia uniflora]|uniref:Uncharacterized protein n=1 Tax=Kingdonia uniflora TaxID=39325 RepID=A0A7J7P2X6_9MAGN|nr:hypothetical protein GIB67_003807 [Kingdonia uniflora]